MSCLLMLTPHHLPECRSVPMPEPSENICPFVSGMINYPPCCVRGKAIHHLSTEGDSLSALVLLEYFPLCGSCPTVLSPSDGCPNCFRCVPRHVIPPYPFCPCAHIHSFIPPMIEQPSHRMEGSGQHLHPQRQGHLLPDP